MAYERRDTEQEVMTTCRLGPAEVLAGALLLLLTAAPVTAHTAVGPLGDINGGFEHPFFGPDHFLAMFAIGLWGAQMGGPSARTLPVTFPRIMVVGG
jgi:urease accessory protein